MGEAVSVEACIYTYMVLAHRVLYAMIPHNKGDSLTIT